MTADAYLQNILQREAVDVGLQSPVRGVQAQIEPLLRQWAGDRLVGISPSGSFAKHTANRSGTDIDLFISLCPQTEESLKEIYNKLFNYMERHGYNPKRQNVSIKVKVKGYDVDLVPGKRQDFLSGDHSLYRRKADSWTKTDVGRHIIHVLLSGKTDEIRIVKMWRDQLVLDFPSFYLELTVIRALSGVNSGTLAGNIWKVFEYLRDDFINARIVDPANSNNVISNDLTAVERNRVKAAASRALGARIWEEIIK